MLRYLPEMALGGNCGSCDNLREEASAAIQRHIQAVGRREVARLQHDSELVAALDIVVNEAAEARKLAVTAYKRHMDSHRSGQTPAAAGSGA